MQTIEHFLMTRFNMSSPGKEKDIRSQPGWLAHRFDLFERLCLPSVLAQTRKDFRWIIYFDVDTPAEFKQRVAELSADGAFVPFYTHLFQSDGWRESVQKTFAPASDFVLTTRLDNDDALATDFIARLRDAIAGRAGAAGFYNFTYGLIRDNDSVYRVHHPSNAFFSLLEPNIPAFRTAPSVQHMRIAEAGPVFQIGGAPAWMQVVHDRNVSNRIRGWKVSSDGIASRFAGGAGHGLARAGRFAVIAENATLGVLRAARDQLINIARRHV